MRSFAPPKPSSTYSSSGPMISSSPAAASASANDRPARAGSSFATHMAPYADAPTSSPRGSTCMKRPGSADNSPPLPRCSSAHTASGRKATPSDSSVSLAQSGFTLVCQNAASAKGATAASGSAHTTSRWTGRETVTSTERWAYSPTGDIPDT